MKELQVIQTDRAPAAIGPYAQAIKVGNTVYTSGQIPLTAEGELVENDAATQTRQVFENLRAVLAAAGTSLSRVVKTTVFVSDLNDFGTINEVYAEAFGLHRPARSTVQVARLPRDAKVEIEVIASLED
ncbi:MAG: RidA family protein [Acidibacillus sp.]|uniref:2-iminobutanoate/2-iminopropanoate deaminase n=1 Tax=Sulfoacidibacillus ferrooxidans TaxID=2005001 RepID=A0A9X2ACR8_9BACL|nr:2-iminobutanoate/2-iminopropanoate deaminase [Sulfoacidibacillus ferrooxidans]MCY0894108.1 RidA family protein [Acidibacillus sp.]